MGKEAVYITGHRHPDSDSIISAIAYANLKQQLGVDAIPCRLGDVSVETNYLLERFGFEKPMLFEDARAIVSDIEIDDPVSIHQTATIRELIEKMSVTKRESFGVVDESEKLVGMVSKGDLGAIGLGDTAVGIEFLQKTPVASIAKTIDGKIIYEGDNVYSSGKVSIPAINDNLLSKYNLKNRIVILGDDEKSQIEAINKEAAILIVVWSDTISDKVIELAKKQNCAIISSGHGTLNTSRYLYFSPSIELVMKRDLVYFNHNEFVEDVEKRMLKTRFRSYPVVDNKNHLVGYISRFHLLDYPNKKVIMVDHNEYAQSVKGIEQADLLEVVDHHRIYDIWTNHPISFRNEIIGSTASIITSMFLEHRKTIDKNLAGLLLGAIVSDTLKFKSPTTTQRDKELAKYLSDISGVNIDELATSMFTISSNISNRNVDDLINQDIKKFEIGKYKVLIGQVIVSGLSQVKPIEKELQEAMNEFRISRGCDLIIMAFTSILEDGSSFYYDGLEGCVEEAFPNVDGIEHTPQKHILSRKNQIVPRLTKVLNNY